MLDLTRPIIGIENRTAQEVFDIMCDRFRAAERALAERAGGVKAPIGYALVPVEPTDRMVSAYVAAKPKGAGFNHPRKGDDKKAWFAAHEKKCRERWKAMLSVSALTTEPATPSALVDQITDDVWAADKSDENPAVIDRDGPAAPEDREAVTWTGLLEILAESSFVSESRAATLRAIAEHLRFARPAEQAVTEAMVEAMVHSIARQVAKRDGYVGHCDVRKVRIDGEFIPRAALKAAMEAGRHD